MSGLWQKALAEAIGSFLLLATVVGSGIMADSLSGGNTALALLGNTIPTGAILVVLITILGPISGAHFNPLVSIAALLRGELAARVLPVYLIAQLGGAVLGVLLAHAMFDQDILQVSQKIRSGPGQWISEAVATSTLIVAIYGTLHRDPERVPLMVGLTITAAYWFTASTSFANPAVTLARSLTNSFAGIAPTSLPGFLVAQAIGLAIGLVVVQMLWPQPAVRTASSD